MKSDDFFQWFQNILTILLDVGILENQFEKNSPSFIAAFCTLVQNEVQKATQYRQKPFIVFKLEQPCPNC